MPDELVKTWTGVRFGSSTPRVRLICYPHAGGAASAFGAWRHHLPEGVEVVALEPPGRWRRHRELAFRRVEDAADAALPAVRALVGDCKTVLVGHSLGSLVAYELARRLRGTPDVVGLIVSGKRAPDGPPPARLWQLDDDDLVSALRRIYGPARLAALDDEETRPMFLRTLRADLEADGEYRAVPGPLLEQPVWAFAGDDDHETPLSAMADWARVTTGPCRLASLPGGHFFPFDDAATFWQRVGLNQAVLALAT